MVRGFYTKLFDKICLLRQLIFDLTLIGWKRHHYWLWIIDDYNLWINPMTFIKTRNTIHRNVSKVSSIIGLHLDWFRLHTKMREFSGGYQIACGIGKIKDAHMVENCFHHRRYLSMYHFHRFEKHSIFTQIAYISNDLLIRDRHEGNIINMSYQVTRNDQGVRHCKHEITGIHTFLISFSAGLSNT